MIDLKDLRENPDKYRQGAAAKQMTANVDGLLDTDAKLRAVMTELQELTAEKNRIGKDIGAMAGQLKKAANPEERAEVQKKMAALQARPAAMKTREAELAKLQAELETRRDALWLHVPQPADPDVPVGKSAEDNVEIRRWNPSWFDPRKSFADNKGFEPKSHVELGLKHGMMDFERGVRMAGSRSYVLTGAGALLHQAILRCAHDFMVHENGFTSVIVPVLVKESIMIGTGFFPQGKEQAYVVGGAHMGEPISPHDAVEPEKFLTGTGEVGLMGLHQDEIVDESKLPLCYTTVSTCFRREAGAAGKDTSGLFRIHQFDKCEQVVICRADEAESRRWHQKMMGFVETLMQRLEIPYRLLQCCTADLGPKNADQIDIESWMPSRGPSYKDGKLNGAYCETHSASRLYDYQTRRLNIRYKDKAGKNVVTHSLNNTVAASPRILIPIMELYQNADGSITVPKILRPYMNNIEKIG